MRRPYRHAIPAVAVVLCPLAAWQGWATGNRWLFVFAAIGACYLCYLVGRLVHAPYLYATTNLVRRMARW